jgi:hypothetical protein
VTDRAVAMVGLLPLRSVEVSDFVASARQMSMKFEATTHRRRAVGHCQCPFSLSQLASYCLMMDSKFKLTNLSI